LGFTSQGLFQGSYYRRKPASYDKKFAWIFEGIDDEFIGDFGFSGGGAAGYELDRADSMLGTPPNAVVLASSEAHQAHFVLVHEEQLTHVDTVPRSAQPPGGRPEDLIRADIIYFDTPEGGGVFSAGSITFTGSLPWNGGGNNVSRMVENVIRNFLKSEDLEE
jgi:N,N-dimethylformamidase